MSKVATIKSDSIREISDMYNSLLDLAARIESSNYEYLVAKADEFLDWCCEEIGFDDEDQ